MRQFWGEVHARTSPRNKRHGWSRGGAMFQNARNPSRSESPALLAQGPPKSHCDGLPVQEDAERHQPRGVAPPGQGGDQRKTRTRKTANFHGSRRKAKIIQADWCKPLSWLRSKWGVKCSAKTFKRRVHELIRWRRFRAMRKTPTKNSTGLRA